MIDLLFICVLLYLVITVGPIAAIGCVVLFNIGLVALVAIAKGLE